MTPPLTPDPTRRRPLGRTGLLVPPVCVGCAPLASMPDTFGYAVSEADALATVRAIFKSEISFLDTAASYGDGESERRIGLVLREIGGAPNGFVLATKADRNLQTGDFSGDQMKRSVERSLRLLGVDRLSVCYLHDPEHVSFEEMTRRGGALDVLRRLTDEGVIEHLGVAGGPIDLMIRYVDLGCFEAVITHNRYTLLNREAEPLLERATKLGIAALNAAPYGSGILAKGPSAYPRYMYRDASAELLERARYAEAACARHGVPLAAAALQFSLRDPRVTSTIVGMTRPERLAQTIELARVPIPDDLWQELGVT
ncbi:MAG: aldo/keto reductase [Chloroflexota bacterium]